MSSKKLIVMIAALAFAYLFGAFSGRHDLFPFHQLHALRAMLAPPQAPPSRYTFDELDRLVSDESKQAVACPTQTARTAVLLVLGQSNAGNHGGQRFASQYGAKVVNFSQGQCFVASSPLLGSSGTRGEYWTELGNRLISSGQFDGVVLALVTLTGSEVLRWARGGDLNSAMLDTLRELKAHNYRITQVLWHQGEVDYVQGTSESAYRDRFLSLVNSLREQDVSAPIYISVASKCLEPSNGGTRRHDADNPVTRAQSALPQSAKGIVMGVDTDALLYDADRYDDCHFGASGSEKAAQAWADLLLKDSAPAVSVRDGRTACDPAKDGSC